MRVTDEDWLRDIAGLVRQCQAGHGTAQATLLEMSDIILAWLREYLVRVDQERTALVKQGVPMPPDLPLLV